MADEASNQTLTWSLVDPSSSGLITQYAENSTSSTSQDRAQVAQFEPVGIQNGGQVVATFSNGEQRIEVQLALATIQNPDSPTNVGNNNFAVTSDTATPSVGLHQTGGRGK